MNLDDHNTSSVNLGDYVAVLRRRAILILIITGVVAALAGVASRGQPTFYEAKVKIVVRPLIVDPNATRLEPVDLQTERQVMSSLLLAERVKERIQTDLTASELLENLTVAVPEETGVLAVTYEAGKAQVAQQTAQAFAETYLTMRTAEPASQLADELKTVTAELDKAEAALLGLNRIVAQTTANTLENADAKTRRDVVSGEITQLQQRSFRLRATKTDGGSIITAALEPTAPAGAPPMRNGAIGAAAGLLLGIIVAFVRERTDRKVRTVAQAEALFGRPVVSTIPTFSGSGNASLIALEDSDGLGGDVFRRLRAKLLSTFDVNEASLLVASARSGEGASTVAANFASTLARTGGRVVLVEADLYNPTLQRSLGQPDHPGLAEVLRDEATMGSALQWVEEGRLAFLASGASTAQLADGLQSEAMRDIHHQLRTNFDFVVYDGPPLLGTADALALVPLADVTLLVASGPCEKDVATTTVMELTLAGAKRIGLVLNRFSGTPVASNYFKSKLAHRRTDAPAVPAWQLRPALSTIQADVEVTGVVEVALEDQAVDGEGPGGPRIRIDRECARRGVR
jgi:capsular exopolysaccharide synthesis family protein